MPRDRHGVQMASIRSHRCPMFDPACAARVIQHISAKYPQPFDATVLVEERCGRYTRGAHKGQLRGWAEIDVVSEGGWQRLGPGEGNGRVLYPGTVLAIRITAFDGSVYLEAV